MKTSVRFIALIIAITATFVTQTVRVQGAQSVVMTEESSSILDVIFNGMDITATGVNNTSPDHWTVTLPGSVTPPSNSIFVWSESATFLDTADPHGFNILTWISSTQLSLISDTGFPTNGNIFATNSGQTLNGPDGTVYQYTDVSDVPDTGSAFGLLAVALAALLGASRLRSLRLA